MREANFTDMRTQAFERTMISGLTIFAAVAIVHLAGSANLMGPLLFSLCCLSIALPFLIFQIACTTLGIPQRHKILLQTSTVIISLVGVTGLLISVSSLIGILFAISCISAYYLFTVFSADTESCETAAQAQEAADRTQQAESKDDAAKAESESKAAHHYASQP
jgi:hypothetical protein